MIAEPIRFRFLRLRRWSFFGLVAVTSGAGTWLMVRIVGAGGFTPLEIIILALFTPTFVWISIPFWTAVAGFTLRVARREPITPGSVKATATSRVSPRDPGRGTAPPCEPPEGLTAVVIPIYNEDPRAVAARVSAMAGSLVRVGSAERFHVHLLSDTSDPAIAREEEEAWLGIQAEYPEVPVSYRRRERNTGRKAGNVFEFCRRCVADYEYMVVLDADSVMTGETLVALARKMDDNPEVGLIQTMPLPARQRTLFGRLVQFAACLYGPMLATGQSFWQGDAANYWGHNAILRLRAFTDEAGLPVLPGRAPFGGEILSHDFVEAALLRRAGWKVVLDPSLGGSWEEVPATVVDFARRDRRWAQGSLQHLRLLGLRGLHPLNRLHFALGAMGYVSSLLWLLLLICGTVYVLLPGIHGPSLLAGSGGTPLGVSLLAVTAAVLFLPKALGLLLGLFAQPTAFGGRRKLVASATLETVFSVLLAPVMMLYHARFVIGILAGRSVEWGARDPDRSALSWPDAAKAAALPTVLGIIWGGATLTASPSFFVWMSPIFLGLLLAAPLIRLTASAELGLGARSAGLLLVPSEAAPTRELEAVRLAMSGAATPSYADPSDGWGVHQPPRKSVTQFSQPPGRSMHHAERGLFDLRQGRPFLITDARAASSSSATHGALIAGVEELDDRLLDRLRSLSGSAPRLVLTRHRLAAMDNAAPYRNGSTPRHYSLRLEADVTAEQIAVLACGPVPDWSAIEFDFLPADQLEAAALGLVRLGRLLPAVVVVPVQEPFGAEFQSALESAAILRADTEEVLHFIEAAGSNVVQVGDAPVPLPEAEDSRFILFREASGLQEHVAILVRDQAEWPDPVPVRLHSACLTGDLFGSLRCDCGDQLRSSMDMFATRGGGVLLYLAQEGRGIGLRNKFRAYTLQEDGLDTIEADGTLGFGPDERRYDVAAQILDSIGVERVELLTNNPEKVRAMQEAGITVVRRQSIHGTLTRHNLPYVRAKVQRAGHWLGDMLSQPLSGD